MKSAERLLHLFEQAWTPKPFLNHDEYACAKAMVNNQDLQENLPWGTIPVDEVQMTQIRHDPETVQQYAKEGKTNGGLVLRRMGENHLFDGHHRYRAAQANGQPEYRARIFEMKDKPMSLNRLARKLKVEKEDLVHAMDTDDKRQYE